MARFLPSIIGGLLLAIGITATAAEPQKQPTMVVIAGLQPTTSVAESEAAEGMFAYIKGRNDLRFQSAEIMNGFFTTLELKGDDQARAELKQAEELFKQGKIAFEQLKLTEAAQLLEASLTSFDKSLPYMETNQSLLSTHLYLGLTYDLLQKTEPADRHIQNMLRLDVAGKFNELNLRQFTPKTIARVNKVRQEINKTATANLNISADPLGGGTGARVLLDGERVGVIPLKLSGLKTGAHTVTVLKRGFERTSEKMELRSGTNRLEVKLKRWAPFKPVASNPFLDPSKNTTFRALATELKADVLLLAEVNPEDNQRGYVLSGQAFSTSTGVYSHIDRIKIVESGSARQSGFNLCRWLLEHVLPSGEIQPQLAHQEGAIEKSLQPPLQPLTPEGPLPVFNPTMTVKATAQKKQFYQQPVFWGIVGGVVAATGLSILLFTDVAKPDADNNVLVIDNPGVGN